MDLVLFGIQGSGKGTQAKRLAVECGFQIFETGGELRRIAAAGTELGNTVKSYIDTGKHAPTAIVMQVVSDAIGRIGSGQNILFDGIPRNPEQMELFNSIMQKQGRLFHCVQLTLPREEAVQRVLGRAALEGRADDADESAIRERMRLFDEKTQPVIAAYRASGNMIYVDGRGSMEEVYGKLKEAMGY